MSDQNNARYFANEVVLIVDSQSKDIELLTVDEYRDSHVRHASLKLLAADFPFRNEFDFRRRKEQVFFEFVTLVVGHGVDPTNLHNVLLEVKEYVDGCSPDLLGVFELLLGDDN